MSFKSALYIIKTYSKPTHVHIYIQKYIEKIENYVIITCIFPFDLSASLIFGKSLSINK